MTLFLGRREYSRSHLPLDRSVKEKGMRPFRPLVPLDKKNLNPSPLIPFYRIVFSLHRLFLIPHRSD
jgi:hypothetical protein